MPEPIRVLHFADVHIGVENYGRTDPESGLSTRVLDFLHRMDDVIAIARERDIDLIVFAGDAFQTRTPNPTYQREFAYRMLDLSEIAPVVMLVGNHDLPPAVLKASSIEIYETLRVPNIWVASNYEGRVIETKRGPVYVASAPYPIRARLMEDERTQGKTVREIDDQMQLTLANIIDGLAVEADTHAMPRLLTGHFTVSGAQLGSEQRITMLSRDIAVQISDVADDRWDYVALGHIHKHQNLTRNRSDAPPVVYAGSLERIDFGEEGDPKGFCIVELARGETRWEFVQVDARRFVTLDIDLRTSDDPTGDAIAALERSPLLNAVVRVFVKLTPEREPSFNEALFRDMLRRQGAFFFTVRKEVESPERARLGSSPEGMTPTELLDRYLMSRETPAARRAELLAEAERIFGVDEL